MPSIPVLETIVERSQSISGGERTARSDRAIGFIGDSKQVAPNKPFFLYFAPGANHAPHHVPKEWTDKYKGMFDDVEPTGKPDIAKGKGAPGKAQLYINGKLVGEGEAVTL